MSRKTGKHIRFIILSFVLPTAILLLTHCKKDKKTEDPTSVVPVAPVCDAPAISSSTQGTVNTSVYSFTATVTNINNSSLVILTLNGFTLPFSYNTSTGILLATFTLSPGANTINIVANGCSVVTKNFDLFYGPNNTMNLTGKDFKITAYTSSPPFSGMTDIYPMLPSCEKDNIFRFNSDGTLTEDQGASKCNTADPQTSTGTWAWSSDQTQLTMNLNSVSTTYSVNQNDGTILKLTFSQIDNGTTYYFTITFTKQ